MAGPRHRSGAALFARHPSILLAFDAAAAAALAATTRDRKS
jgi:hypothetical protein